jgi:hypothetical protein
MEMADARRQTGSSDELRDVACGEPVGAVLVEKIVAVLNGESLNLQDFEDCLPLTAIYRSNWSYIDLILLRQEAICTRIIPVDEAEVSDTSVSWTSGQNGIKRW